MNVAIPVFSFESEILTDAPFSHIAERIGALGSAVDLPCLKPIEQWLPLEASPAELRLRWERRCFGAIEVGCLTIRPDAKGAHLRLEGHMKGWGGFLLFGLLRWRTDRLLDRFVEEL